MAFYIFLSPVRSDEKLEASVAGDVLTVNGQALDFGPLPNGGELPEGATGCPWVVGPVVRTYDGAIELTLLFPHGPVPWPAPPEARVITHPSPIYDVIDGPVPFPTYTPPDDVPMVDPNAGLQLEDLVALGGLK